MARLYVNRNEVYLRIVESPEYYETLLEAAQKLVYDGEYRYFITQDVLDEIGDDDASIESQLEMAIKMIENKYERDIVNSIIDSMIEDWYITQTLKRGKTEWITTVKKKF